MQEKNNLIYAMRCEKHTYQEIGEKFHITRQRVEQILKRYPKVKINWHEEHRIKIVCIQCGKEIWVYKSPIALQRQYCSKDCINQDSDIFRKFGKTKRQIVENGTPEERKQYFKWMNDFSKEYRKKWFAKRYANPEIRKKILKRNYAFLKEYNQRPEVIEKRRKIAYERYHNDTEYRNKCLLASKKNYEKNKSKN